MPLNDGDIAEFKQRLREMSEEELRLGLDMGTISLAWKRSLAEMELKRREGEEWATRFNAQEAARGKAQKFQAAQMVEQLEVARDQAGAARGAATAAKWSAVAAIGIVFLTAILAFVAVRPLFAPDPRDMPAATASPSSTKSE